MFLTFFFCILEHSLKFLHRDYAIIDQYFLILMLQPFNTVPPVVVTPNHDIILLLLHNSNFDTVVNHNISIQYAGYLIYDPMKGSVGLLGS